jgi:hypothetical protein
VRFLHVTAQTLLSTHHNARIRIETNARLATSRSRKVLAQEDCSRTAGAAELGAPDDPSRILMFRGRNVLPDRDLCR